MVGMVGRGHRAGPWAQQGRTDGQSISTPRRKSSRAAGVGPGSFVEGVFQQDFCSVTRMTATEACQGSTPTLLHEAPKDSMRWVLVLIPPSLQMRQPPQVTQGVSVRGERGQASAGQAAGAEERARMGSRGAEQEGGPSGGARQGGVENHCRDATT